MCRVEALRGFEFDQDSVLDQKIGPEPPDSLPSIPDRDRSLLPNPQPGLSQDHRDGRLVNRLQKPTSELILDLVTSADDAPGEGLVREILGR